MKTLALTILLASLAACGSDEPAGNASFPEAPLVIASGRLTHVEVRTAPTQPPERGVLTVDMRFADASGKPLEGLSIDVVPWMPAMGHGTSIVPTVTEKGAGEYVVEGVAVTMPGTWELRTKISGAVSDDVAPSFDVP